MCQPTRSKTKKKYVGKRLGKIIDIKNITGDLLLFGNFCFGTSKQMVSNITRVKERLKR